MQQYLDQFNQEDWGAFFSQLRQDAEAFFSADQPLDTQAYRRGIADITGSQLPIEGVDAATIAADIRTHVLAGSIHQHHKQYIAFPDKGSLASAQYAALLAALTNQNLIAEDKSAPTGTYIEMKVITWLRQLIGFAPQDWFPKNALELGGACVSGGVMANTIGLLGARQRAFPKSKTKGMQSLRQTPVVFVAGSTMSHYSHYGSSWWLGIGTENVRAVACTENGNMDQADLTRQIEQCMHNNERVIAIIALAGDSRTHTIDDLPGLYEIAQRYDIWLHADACHGGILTFDDSFTHGSRHFLSYCDSLSFDPHKHLSIPYASSVVLFKDASALAEIGSSTDITIAYGGNDIGQVTPFLGSRGFDALKLYAAIRFYGVNGIRDHIRKRKEITRAWYELLDQSPLLMPLHEPELFAVAFSVRPSGIDAVTLSTHNRLLHDTLQENGRVIVHNFNMCDYRNMLGYGAGVKIRALGSQFGDDDYTMDDLRGLLAVIEDTYLSLQLSAKQGTPRGEPRKLPLPSQQT